MKEQFLNAMEFRHACKLFDASKSISDEDLRYILEAGRLSPSSVGLEQWKFLVAKTAENKLKIQEGCFNQPQVGTASIVVVILAKTLALEPRSEYIDRLLHRLAHNDEEVAGLKSFYEGYYSSIRVGDWSAAQCHIAAANMMTAAAFIGIDSCPIGAFEANKVLESLNVDKKEYELALVVPFGYRVNEAQPKKRMGFDEIVEFLD